jgi:sporulation protein YlmC with PRC-barrel domain
MRLRRTKDLSQYTIAATDTDIGRVHDFYFDDEKWTIRYIVVATGEVLSGRKVLISLVSLRYPAWSPLHLRVNLTWEQIKNCPAIDVHTPVSRQHEAEHHKHFGLPPYWDGTDVWGSWPNPRALAEAPRSESNVGANRASSDVHLRSTRDVTGYHIMATDGEVGHLEDFLFDEDTWEIRYAIVDTKNWWPGKKVLLRPRWIKRVSWADREIYANMTREIIRKGPEWDPNKPVSREFELRLHNHYGYAPYWTVEK